MKVKMLRWYNALLTVLLGWLGFASCDSGEDEYGAPLVEYGVPHATYVIGGTVTNADSGAGVAGIAVRAEHHLPESYGVPMENAELYHDTIASTTTDGDGKFVFEQQTFYIGESESVQLVFEDVDGDAGGGDLRSDTLALDTLSKRKVAGGNGWNEGTYEVRADVRLSPKADK